MRNAKSQIFVPVDLYNLEGDIIASFESVISCAKYLNCYNSILFEILNGKRKSYKGITVIKQGDVFNYVKSSKARNMAKYYK